MKKLLMLPILLGCAIAFAAPESCDPEIHNYSGWMERHNSKLKFIQQYSSEIQIAFFGDSITHFFEDTGKTVWNQYFNGTPYRALNCGYGGDLTQHVLWRMLNGELDGYHAKALVLMIGTNNAGANTVYREPQGDTVLGIKKCVELMQEKQPDAVVILCSISPRGTDKNDGYRKRNDIVNKELEKFCDGKKVIWCDWGPQMLEPDETLPVEMCSTDYLHPTVKGYKIWVKNLLPLFASIIDPKDPSSCLVPSIKTEREWWDAIAAARGDVSDKNVAFLGDSFLEGFYSVAPDARKDLLGDKSELNLTFQGDLLQNVLWRAKNGELNGFAADDLIVCAGNANTNRTPVEVAAGITTLVEAAKDKQKKAKILLTPILPMGREKDSALRKWAEETNELLRGIEKDGVKIVDPASVLLDEAGNLPEKYSADGVSLTKEGYEAWGALLKSNL
ncbi:hypothetical protein IJS98_02340 [bacterium]|nr:hypothetical protein [bacterium]